jgi:hypothetical protein
LLNLQKTHNALAATNLRIAGHRHTSNHIPNRNTPTSTQRNEDLTTLQTTKRFNILKIRLSFTQEKTSKLMRKNKQMQNTKEKEGEGGERETSPETVG